jgi:hypothetical protein
MPRPRKHVAPRGKRPIHLERWRSTGQGELVFECPPAHVAKEVGVTRQAVC